MNKLLKSLDENLEIYIASVFLIIFSFFTIIQIFMRYFFNIPLAWSEELSRYAFLWFVYVSTSYAVKHKRHVRFTFFVNKLGKRAKSVIETFALLCLLGFLIFLAVSSFQITDFMYQTNQLSPANRIPMYLVYLCVPIGALLMIFRVLQHVVSTVKEIR